MDGCTLFSWRSCSPRYIRALLLGLLVTSATQRYVTAEKWVSVDGNNDELRVVEYCETEIFHAECPEGKVIVMRSANYGRMKFGRCVDRDYGYVGCSTDVLRITDKLCSGRPSCDVPVPNSAFRRTQPCPKDLKPYFEAEYTCVTVQDARGAPCIKDRPILITSPSGYLAKAMAELSGHGSTKCPWLIEAKPGQTIAITLLDFSLSDWTNTNAVGNGGVCLVTAVIRETTESRGIRVCGGDGRERDVYTTVTNAVEIRMVGPQSSSNDGGHYLLRYQVQGCADPEPPSHAWLKRRGDKAFLGCESLDVKWQLECKGNRWEGDVAGNCTSPTQEVSLIIITAIAVAIGIIILSIGLICLRWRINKRQCSRDTAGKQGAPPNGNTYDGKSHRAVPRPPPGSQDSFPPPPPPEVDHEMLIQNETENEYAYIADMPPPPPLAGGSHTNLSDNSSEAAAAAITAPSSGSKEQGYPQKVFHDFYPTSPTPYEQSPVPSPYHSRQPSSGAGVTPKLLAHECALSGMTDCGHYGPHLGSPAQGQRVRRASGRSRLGSDGAGDPPTYFELEPEEEVFSFVMHMPSTGNEGPVGGMPHTPPPPPTPPVAPPGFFKVSNHNGHIHHHPHSHLGNNNNNNPTGMSSTGGHLHHLHHQPHHHANLNHNQPHHVNPRAVAAPKVGPKTAPKPKRQPNPGSVSNRASMPLQFSNGEVGNGEHNQNTL